MVSSHARIENLRNFSELDVTIAEGAVIVGENKVGRSNVDYALRLSLERNKPECHRCSDWSPCDTDCTVNRVSWND